MIAVALLAVVLPVFAPNATLLTNGANPQPLPAANHPSKPSYVSWTPHPPTRTPTPIRFACESGTPGTGASDGVGAEAEPPTGWQPTHEVLVVPISVDIGNWVSTDLGNWYYDRWFPPGHEQDVINTIHEAIQQINAFLLNDALDDSPDPPRLNIQLQVRVVNLWSGPDAHDLYSKDTTAVEDFWNAHPEYPKPVLAWNNGSCCWASNQPNAQCDAFVVSHLWWSDYLGYPSPATFGYYAGFAMGNTVHEVGHALGSYWHADCYDPPVNWCHSTNDCYNGPLICPADLRDLSIMSYCGCASGSDCQCGAATRFAPRIARIIRWKTEQQWCTEHHPELTVSEGPDSDHDGVPDSVDNCTSIANHWQGDFDDDGTGDACPPGGHCAGAAPDGSMATPLMLPVALLMWGRWRWHGEAP